ncbi:MAG: HAD hydrolase family protein [Bacteroidia bacterium]
MELFLSDLDGTLLDRSGRLSLSSRERLSVMLRQGLPFSVATARGWPGTRRVLGDLGIRLPIIVRNGAYVLDYQSGAVLHGNLINPETACQIVQFFRERATAPAIAVFSGGEERMYGEPPQNIQMATYADLRKQQGTPSWEEVDSLMPWLENPVAQFNIIDEGDKILDFRDELEIVFKDKIQLHTYENALQPGWRMLSILAAEATKGAAAKWLLSYLCLNAEGLTVFGDNYNDLPMMKIAGKAVAVGNAQAAVMRVAHTILRYDVEDEVVNYIESNWRV